MKQLISLVIIAIVLVGVAVFIYSGDNAESPAPTQTSIPIPTVEETTTPSLSPTPTASKVTVTYSDSGYSPSTVKIKKGDSVVFNNGGSRMMWTASDVHPTHRAYPGSGLEMCGTQTLVAIFDSCGGFGTGESWEFKFDNQGTWNYHNHLQANHYGMVIVE